MKKKIFEKMLKMLLIGLARLFTPCQAVSGAIRGPYKRNNSVPSMLRAYLNTYSIKVYTQYP